VSSAVVKLLEQLLEAARGAEEPAPPPAPAAPEYLSIADFAARLAITPKAVRGMLADGMPHARPRPRTIRIPVARAEAWIAERTAAAASDPSTACAIARRRATLDARRGALQ
jgi:hypothetical protein